MYLSRLSDEMKEVFLDLSIYAAKSNDEVSDVEKLAIDAYCREMELPEPDYVAKKSFEDNLAILASCTKEEKNIVFIEILALLGADDIYDALEKEFIQKLQDKLAFEKGKLFEIIYALRQLKETKEFFEQIINA